MSVTPALQVPSLTEPRNQVASLSSNDTLPKASSERLLHLLGNLPMERDGEGFGVTVGVLAHRDVSSSQPTAVPLGSKTLTEGELEDSRMVIQVTWEVKEDDQEVKPILIDLHDDIVKYGEARLQAAVDRQRGIIQQNVRIAEENLRQAQQEFDLARLRAQLAG